MRLSSAGLAPLMAALAASSATAAAPMKVAAPPPGGYHATITRTAHGVPHITASNYANLGYGAGFAAAQDNFCDFADRMLTVTA